MSSEQSADGGQHWQQCEMPECLNEVPKAKGICDECGEKDTMRFKHTDGYTMCVECGTNFKEHRRDD
jgi:predicted nucleic acid-binding Zn ribbon protein